MGWMDKRKQTAEKAAEAAESIAAIGKLKLEIRPLAGKMAETSETIGAKIYALHESGTEVPAEATALCQAGDKSAAEIKAKESQIEKIKAVRQTRAP